MLRCLYSLCNDESGVDLTAAYEELKDDIVAGVFPMGEDPGGNLILRSTQGDDGDAIYFWDRLGFLANRLGKSRFRITINIEEFHASLHSVVDA